MARDDQPSSPWRADTDAEALVASGHWPTSLDAARGRQHVLAIKETLRSVDPPAPKSRATSRPRTMRRTG